MMEDNIKLQTVVIDAARAYRRAELDGTPRMWRGKALQDLATALDEAIEVYDANVLKSKELP